MKNITRLFFITIMLLSGVHVIQGMEKGENEVKKQEARCLLCFQKIDSSPDCLILLAFHRDCLNAFLASLNDEVDADKVVRIFEEQCNQIENNQRENPNEEVTRRHLTRSELKDLVDTYLRDTRQVRDDNNSAIANAHSLATVPSPSGNAISTVMVFNTTLNISDTGMVRSNSQTLNGSMYCAMANTSLNNITIYSVNNSTFNLISTIPVSSVLPRVQEKTGDEEILPF